MAAQFADRAEAGKVLATKLSAYANAPNALVLALPRGGVPVAYEVAIRLKLPLDVMIVRKLGVPGREEMAFGAIASGDVRLLNPDIVRSWQISKREIDAITARELRELERRESAYRDDRPKPAIKGKTILLIDDGVATGATMHAAVAALRQQQPARIVVAVPTAAPSTNAEFRAEVDEMICVITPDPFEAVGLWYEDFSQTTDDQVRDLLRRAASS